MDKYFSDKNYEWSVYGLEKCLKENKLDSSIIVKNKNAAIVKVECYHDSVILGALTSWCISQHECSWNQYVKDNGNYQIFIFDFSKDPGDDLSIIGATWRINTNSPHLICCYTRPNVPINQSTGHSTDFGGLTEAIIKPIFGNDFNLSEIIADSIKLKNKFHTVEAENTDYDSDEFTQYTFEDVAGMLKRIFSM